MKAVTVFIVMKRDGGIVIVIAQSIPSISIPPKAYVKCRNCLWFSTSGQQGSKGNMGNKATRATRATRQKGKQSNKETRATQGNQGNKATRQ